MIMPRNALVGYLCVITEVLKRERARAWIVFFVGEIAGFGRGSVAQTETAARSWAFA